jgi:cytochrome c553
VKKLILMGLFLAQSLLFADGSAYYQACKGCHGEKGEKVANGVSKIINKMSKEEFIVALKGYKDGSYGGKLKGLMKGQAVRLDENKMEAIADLIIK